MKKPENIDIKQNSPPQGYNPLEVILGALYHEICVPFKKTPVWCLLKTLSYMELKSGGNISCLYLPRENEEKKELSIDEIIETKNAQEAICKLAFVRPSYDQIISEITKTDFLISEKKEELKKINEKIKLLKGAEKRKAEKKSLQIEYQIGFLLPDDTMSFVTAWALGVAVTDIKKVSRGILLDAALMAKHYGNNTSDHITGVFTDFQKEDINKHGIILYNEFMEAKRREEKLKKQNYKWSGK